MALSSLPCAASRRLHRPRRYPEGARYFYFEATDSGSKSQSQSVLVFEENQRTKLHHLVYLIHLSRTSRKSASCQDEAVPPLREDASRFPQSIEIIWAKLNLALSAENASTASVPFTAHIVEIRVIVFLLGITVSIISASASRCFCFLRSLHRLRRTGCNPNHGTLVSDEGILCRREAPVRPFAAYGGEPRQAAGVAA